MEAADYDEGTERDQAPEQEYDEEHDAPQVVWRRPTGRGPHNKEWDTSIGEWVPVGTSKARPWIPTRNLPDKGRATLRRAKPAKVKRGIVAKQSTAKRTRPQPAPARAPARAPALMHGAAGGGGGDDDGDEGDGNGDGSGPPQPRFSSNAEAEAGALEAFAAEDAEAVGAVGA